MAGKKISKHKPLKQRQKGKIICITFLKFLSKKFNMTAIS